jgi:ribosomal-protein-serine acetyltransferase
MFTHRLNDRLELRLYEQYHAEEVYRVTEANRAHISTWLPWVDDVKSIDDTRAFITRSLEQFGRSDGFSCGIWEDNVYVGGLGFIRIVQINKQTEIGYWLAENAQGRGIMTMACRALIDHAFDTLKLNKVEIRCAAGNHRSRAVPKRLGFVEEGTLRQIIPIRGTYHDSVVYGMLASEWPAARVGGEGKYSNVSPAL